MLTIFRRHTKACIEEHGCDKGRSYRRCRCPIHVEGTLAHQFVSHALDLISWEAATAQVREWETAGNFDVRPELTVAEAFDQFLADCIARNLSRDTIRKYKLLKSRVLEFYAKRRIVLLKYFDVSAARAFRETWKLSPPTAIKQMERLRTFFRFCHDSGWIKTNPARVLKRPQIRSAPVQPFSDVEVGRILECAKTPRTKAFVSLLLHTGLRILAYPRSFVAERVSWKAPLRGIICCKQLFHAFVTVVRWEAVVRLI